MQDNIALEQADKVTITNWTYWLGTSGTRYSFRACLPTGHDIGCQDKIQARANRLRVAQGYCNDYYNQQARICQSWKPSDRPPKNLAIAGVGYSSLDLRIMQRVNKSKMLQVLGL